MCLEKLQEDVPVQYLIGKCYFMDMELRIKEGVLIPRPETEILVEKVLFILGKDFKGKGLDIGGGTGCISITLLRNIPNLIMYSNDINPVAINLMKENASLYGVQDRFICSLGNLIEPFQDEIFDFIISNPPYIPRRKWYYLEEKVRKEGYNSLVGGERGTEFYEKLATHFYDNVKRGGFVALEIGHDQGDYVKTLFEKGGFKTELFKDYNGQDRIVIAWK